MAYTAWSVVYGEQPTAAKWNQLGTNDAGFKDGTNIDSLAILDRHIAANNLLATKFSNPYKFSAYRNAAVSTVAGTWVKISFDVEDFDTGSNFATGKFTAPVTGFYLFNWQVGLPVGTANADNVAALYKNGTVIQWGAEQSTPSGCGGVGLLQATAGDYFEIFIFTPNVAVVNVGGSPRKTYFQGCLLASI